MKLKPTLNLGASKTLTRKMLSPGVEPDADRIQQAVAANHIDKLRKEGKTLEKEIAPEHFRRGSVGNYREELPEEIIKDIEWRFSRMLRRWGYQTGDQ